MEQKSVAVIGGGAAGFFGAIHAAEMHPGVAIHIFEKSNSFLSKVKVSGGGRCNVTNACTDPQELVQFYPRGKKELLGPFYHFGPQQTIEWFASRKIKLVAEADNRMFPYTNSSQTIIDCFLSAAKSNGIHLHTHHTLKKLSFADGRWQLTFGDTVFHADAVLMAGGSSAALWKLMQDLGHTIIPPVPSLFTFNIRDPRLRELMGVSLSMVECRIGGNKFQSEGPLLITHWGLSGPAILKLSAFAARWLSEQQYTFELIINFIPALKLTTCFEALLAIKKEHPKKIIQNTGFYSIPSRLFKRLCEVAGINDTVIWADIPNEKLQRLSAILTESSFQVNGKSTFKDEFVTCGGIKLSEVDFKTMQSKLHPGLFFAGEILDIDAVTGGFNFQAAWTTAYIAAEHIISS